MFLVGWLRAAVVKRPQSSLSITRNTTTVARRMSVRPSVHHPITPVSPLVIRLFTAVQTPAVATTQRTDAQG